MAPFYPRLPEPERYIDPITAGVGGLGVGLGVANRALQGQMYGEALAAEREKRQALKEYGETGDIGKLMAAAPEVGVRLQEAQTHQQKAMMDAVKPGLEMAYMLAPSANEENYGALRSSIVKSFPVMEGVLPPNYDKPRIDNFISQYETYLRKGREEQQPGMIYDQATGTWKQAPGPGKVTVARPFESRYAPRAYPIVDEEGNVINTVTSIVRPVVNKPTRAGSSYSFKDFVANTPGMADQSYDKQMEAYNKAIYGGREAAKPPKQVKPPKNIAEWKALPGNENKTIQDYLNYKMGKTPATTSVTSGEPPFPAADNKGKIATSPDGTQWTSDGTKWVLYK